MRFTIETRSDAFTTVDADTAQVLPSGALEFHNRPTVGDRVMVITYAPHAWQTFFPDEDGAA